MLSFRTNKQNKWLQIISSSTKIVNQLVMFVILGILPLIFPQYIKITNWKIIFINLLIALLTSILFEVLQFQNHHKQKNNKWLVNLQLLTSVILLTSFLHFFGRINGPFFVLYLLTTMESFLNQNVLLSNFVIGIMIGSTSLEFLWLIAVGEKTLSLIPILEFGVRIVSIIFMRSYGFALAQRIISEENLRSRLEEVNQKLKDFDQRKDEFISVAAHDLRAPLTAVKGYLSMIMEGDAGKVPKQMEEYLQGALEGTEREIRLVNNMLDISRIEENRLVYQMGKMHLKSVIKEVLTNFNNDIERKDLKLVKQMPEEIKDLVSVDKDRIFEVISNLVSNAIKYTDKGTITISLMNPTTDKIRFEITDSGRGMTKDELRKLFTKFYRADSSAGTILGTGLGLYITKLLVQKFGGTIGVESQLSKGSTFWFELQLSKKDI